MDLHVTLDEIAQLADDQLELHRALRLAVYPPAEWVGKPGMDREWSPPRWCVRGFVGGELVSFVGLVERQCLLNGESVTVGGIGGVKTHPDYRNLGLAGQCLERGLKFLDEQPVDFSQLVCLDHLIPYYQRFGFAPFVGDMEVTQFGQPERFTFSDVMLRSSRMEAPQHGTLDLLGPPW